MRQLKYHEKKLLRKVDFLQWKSENNQRELQVWSAERARPLGSLLVMHIMALCPLLLLNVCGHSCRSSGATTYRTGTTTRSTTRYAA